MKYTFREKITSSIPAVGTLVTLGTPEVTEMLSLCGFDWLFLDMEHGPFSLFDLQRMIQGVRGDCLSLVRVPENSAVWIKRVLDTGCDGIIVPQVNNAEAAQRAVQAAKYPPAGIRGAGISRAHAYGISFREYVASANERLAVIIQIEHVEGVEHLNEILEVPGIDGVQIGPYDLSGSMNRLGQVTSEPVQAALQRIKTECQARAMPFGMFVTDPQAAPREIEEGCNFIAIGTDSIFLWSAAKNALELARAKHSASLA